MSATVPTGLVSRRCGEEPGVQLSGVLGEDAVLSLARNHPKPWDVADALAPVRAAMGS